MGRIKIFFPLIFPSFIPLLLFQGCHYYAFIGSSIFLSHMVFIEALVCSKIMSTCFKKKKDNNVASKDQWNKRGGQKIGGYIVLSN